MLAKPLDESLRDFEAVELRLSSNKLSNGFSSFSESFGSSSLLLMLLLLSLMLLLLLLPPLSAATSFLSRPL